MLVQIEYRLIGSNGQRNTNWSHYDWHTDEEDEFVIGRYDLQGSSPQHIILKSDNVSADILPGISRRHVVFEPAGVSGKIKVTFLGDKTKLVSQKDAKNMGGSQTTEIRVGESDAPQTYQFHLYGIRGVAKLELKCSSPNIIVENQTVVATSEWDTKPEIRPVLKNRVRITMFGEPYIQYLDHPDKIPFGKNIPDRILVFIVCRKIDSLPSSYDDIEDYFWNGNKQPASQRGRRFPVHASRRPFPFITADSSRYVIEPDWEIQTDYEDIVGSHSLLRKGVNYKDYGKVVKGLSAYACGQLLNGKLDRQPKEEKFRKWVEDLELDLLDKFHNEGIVQFAEISMLSAEDTETLKVSLQKILRLPNVVEYFDKENRNPSPLQHALLWCHAKRREFELFSDLYEELELQPGNHDFAQLEARVQRNRQLTSTDLAWLIHDHGQEKEVSNRIINEITNEFHQRASNPSRRIILWGGNTEEMNRAAEIFASNYRYGFVDGVYRIDFRAISRIGDAIFNSQKFESFLQEKGFPSRLIHWDKGHGKTYKNRFLLLIKNIDHLAKSPDVLKQRLEIIDRYFVAEEVSILATSQTEQSAKSWEVIELPPIN